jgi:signal transduction histidine kinase
LLQPRRVVPIAVVAIPLIVAQVRFSRHPWAGPVGALMCVVFFLLAPVSWRALFPPTERARTFAAPFGRFFVYGVAGAGTVFVVGRLLPGILGMPPTFMTTSTSLMVSTALFWVGGYGLGRDVDMERSLDLAHRRADALAHEAERAQLLALRSHLDPHFLFNTLNAIAEWCREDGATAERATLELSAMLRTVLDGTHRSAWPLAQELELSRMLLDLHRVRDPERLTMDLDVDGAPSIEVPPMILLPLTENAVKHGPGAGHRGTVRLRAHTVDDAFVFEVDNPGAFAGERAGGQGLDLVRRRLDHAYEGKATLTICPHGDRTLVRVEIPLSAHLPPVNA